MATDTKALATAQDSGAAVLERVIVAGDLSRLQPAERVAYYRAVCDSVGLNPLTQPFQYITLNGKLTLYATKTATDQLRSIKGISIDRAERDTSDPDYATWLVTGHDTSGRVDTEIGSVAIKGLGGEARANAIMKALTKGKRRLTLSLAGLGWLDESEVSSIPTAQDADVDTETGEIRPAPRQLRDRITERHASVTTSPDRVPPAAPSPEPSPPAPGEGDIVEATAVEVVAMVQCESTSDPAMGPVEQCRREAGHRGTHRTENQTWP